MNTVEIRVIGLPNRTDSIRERLPFSVIEHGDVVIHSQIELSKPLNDHLIWLWGILKHQRRFLKSLQTEGGKLICQCQVSKGNVHLLPNAAEMLHLLEMELVLVAR